MRIIKRFKLMASKHGQYCASKYAVCLADQLPYELKQFAEEYFHHEINAGCFFATQNQNSLPELLIFQRMNDEEQLIASISAVEYED